MFTALEVLYAFKMSLFYSICWERFRRISICIFVNTKKGEYLNFSFSSTWGIKQIINKQNFSYLLCTLLFIQLQIFPMTLFHTHKNRGTSHAPLAKLEPPFLAKVATMKWLWSVHLYTVYSGRRKYWALSKQ